MYRSPICCWGVFPVFKSFLHNRRGNFAIMLTVAAIPLFLAIGVYIDYARQSSAHSHIQALADAAVLHMAALNTDTMSKLRSGAEDTITANLDPKTIETVEIKSLTKSGEQISIVLEGKIDTTFMRFANVNEVGVEAGATAERGVNGQVEVALVLDNTYSMSETDGYGGTKMTALKSAASDLVEKVLGDPKSQVRISVVPYADYVNVGTDNRSASWLDVGVDYIVPGPPRICETRKTRDYCIANAPTYSCTWVTDGVTMTGTCGGGCTKYETRTVTPYQYCTGGGSTTYKWFGCVGSRMPAKWRVTDEKPNIRYPGYVETSQKCPTPITKLTSNKNTVLSAINAMVTNTGSYYPSTYIPSGLIWGQNALSDTEPFTEGKAYDAANIAPRKVVVLMTDGDNTLRFRQSDGRHVAFQSGKETAQRKDTDDDSAAICEYMKSKKIEVFSVAFMVDNAQAKSLLEGCATDSSHYFDASDSEKLVDSFQAIADSLAMVRLVK